MRWIVWLIDAYSLVVLVAVLLSWVQLNPRNPVVRFIAALTEPVLRPLRRVLPAVAGLDFAPVVLLIGLRLLGKLLGH